MPFFVRSIFNTSVGEIFSLIKRGNVTLGRCGNVFDADGGASFEIRKLIPRKFRVKNSVVFGVAWELHFHSRGNVFSPRKFPR